MAVIGILSDTHGFLPDRAYMALGGCDYIIHAGDICDRTVLRDLRSIPGVREVFAVLGNNDREGEYGPEVGRFSKPVIEGVRFLVAHYPDDVRIRPAGSSAVPPGEPVPDICIHGHTHVPSLLMGREAAPAKYVLCPGSVNRPRGGSSASVAFVEIEAGRIVDARIQPLSGARG